LRFLTRLFGKSDDPISRLERTISYRFRDRRLLETALTHRSSLKGTGFQSNERLEFLGDAVLGMAVSDFLYRKFDDISEGDLTRLKAILVNETTLAGVALSFELGNYLFMSPEEEKSGGRQKSSIIADAFEALVGALYIDGGMRPALDIIKEYLLKDYIDIIEDENLHNYKGELLEFVQARGRTIPQYRIKDQIGPDHEKVFVVEVFVQGELLGQGDGRSKKEAEQNAARQALDKIKNGDYKWQS
jgi:ribonuclease-3